MNAEHGALFVEVKNLISSLGIRAVSTDKLEAYLLIDRSDDTKDYQEQFQASCIPVRAELERRTKEIEDAKQDTDKVATKKIEARRFLHMSTGQYLIAAGTILAALVVLYECSTRQQSKKQTETPDMIKPTISNSKPQPCKP